MMATIVAGYHGKRLPEPLEEAQQPQEKKLRMEESVLACGWQHPWFVTKLAQFYADRTLTKSPITPADQAEAYFLLVSKRLSKTTGQVITVDGGLHEAFLR